MELRRAFDGALSAARATLGQGDVARYIPELAHADPALFAAVVQPLEGAALEAGDVDTPFTLQSVSKVFSLARALREGAGDLFRRTSVEPSGDAFHSIVRLEEEQGRPRNPLINAGAILVSERLPGADGPAKHAAFRTFLQLLAEGDFPLDDAVYESEAAHGSRNRSLAHYMAHHGVVRDPAVAVDAYFRQCATRCDVRQLASAATFLARDGVTAAGERLLERRDNRMLLALMTTCGLYDEVGRFAVDVGIPAKSGVSGAILAVVPGQLVVATYAPALGPKGNSVAGVAFLRSFCEALDLSLFSPRGDRHA